MACSHISDDEGYATPAALVVSLALSLVASSMVVRSVQVLQRAKADLARSETEYALAGAHLQAAAVIVRSGIAGPYHWTATTSVGWVEALAEPEAEKLSLDAASSLDDGLLNRFGVADPARLRLALAEAAATDEAPDIGALDPAPLWRACAASLLSRYGEAQTYTFAPRSEPGMGPKPASWHIGEAWRIRITTAAGWRDDRIVRFTGDARHPAAVVVRRLSRGVGEAGQCDRVLAEVSSA